MDPNEYDDSLPTPLHDLVAGNYLKSEKLDLVYAYLTTESDIDMDQPDQGKNTPMHLAVQQEDAFDLVKMLLAFGADVNPLNDDKETPLDVCLNELSSPEGEEDGGEIAALLRKYGAVRGADLSSTPRAASALKPFVRISRREDEKEEENLVESKDSQPKDDWTAKISKTYFELDKNLDKLMDANFNSSLDKNFDVAAAVGLQLREMRLLQMAGSRILCLDGGGLKGLMQIDILCEIEKRTGKKITELFDWIIGTSVGAVIAMGLVHGKQSLQQMRKLMHAAKDDVFGRSWYSRPTSTQVWTKIFQDLVGNMKMDEVKYPRVLATGVYKKTQNLKLHFFSNDPVIDPQCGERLVWKICRYTSAAPMYFDELDGYVDGGVLANNPASSGLTEIQTAYHKLGRKLPISMIVSVSCGRVPEERLGSADIYQLLAPKHWFNFVPRFLSRVSNLISMLGNAVTESEEVSDNVRARCMEENIDYYRFTPLFDEFISLGETDRAKLIDMVIDSHTDQNTKEQMELLMSKLPQVAEANWEMSHR